MSLLNHECLVQVPGRAPDNGVDRHEKQEEESLVDVPLGIANRPVESKPGQDQSALVPQPGGDLEQPENVCLNVVIVIL